MFRKKVKVVAAWYGNLNDSLLLFFYYAHVQVIGDREARK
jgi:hypothetical protein